MLTKVLIKSAPFLVGAIWLTPFREGANKGAESFFLPAYRTISITPLFASRFVAETARIETSSVIRRLA